MNKVNTNDQLNRMKSLMNYGLQNESKEAPYSAVEYQKVGADGKVYGIVREGTKYYIKSAPNKQNLIKEDFGYIGGFRNRKDNEYTSYANAQKHFDLKMMSLKEAANNPTFNVESWDLNKKEMVVTEASDKMKGEILRERQIMKNAMMIMENGKKECNIEGAPCKGKKTSCDKDQPFNCDVDSEFNVEPNIKDENKPVKAEGKKVNGKAVNEEEVLGWNRNKDYMDKSHGTEIGDSAPFDGPEARNIDDQDKKVTNTGEMKNGVVENHGTSMHDTDDQNSPAVGVGEGPSDDNNKPFDDKKGKQIDEALDMNDDVDDVDGGMEDDSMGDEPMGDEPMGDEDPMGDEPEGEPIDTDELGDDDEDLDDDDDEFGDLEDEDPIENDLEDRISDLEDIIYKIADKLGVDTDVDAEDYEDDDLFGDEEGFGDEDEFGDEEDFGDEDEDEFGDEDLGGKGEVDDFDDEEPIEDEFDPEMGAEPTFESRRRGGVQIFETRAFKNAMRKQRMNEAKDYAEYFSKFNHPIRAQQLPPEEDEGPEAMADYEASKKAREEHNAKFPYPYKESIRKNKNVINEDGMTPFTDNGRVPSGNMNKLDDFGKHPAYQKVVMTLPPKDMQEFPGNYDMNDDSVRNDNPYGEKIGDGAPFDIDPESIDNAIAEAFDRLKKKDNRR